ncbi:MAG: serine protease [Candidatus Methanomethylophilaceae archaeon]
MFADACEKMMKCTFPIVNSRHFISGRTESGLGAIVVINPEGWAFTAGHVLSTLIKHNECMNKIRETDAWNRDHPNDKKEYDKQWSDHHSLWIGIPGTDVHNVYINMELDIALIKLKNFRREYVTEYPVFRDPSKVRPGTSICRLGFPFAPAVTTYDAEKRIFAFKEGILPFPFFPNDGIVTRGIDMGTTSPPEVFRKYFVETSSAGLRGQSGGPIFDTSGRIIGIQTKTAHMRLGFNKVVTDDGVEMPEQFMNLGIGVHVKTLMDIMDKKGVKYKSESDDDGYRIIG